MSEVTDFSRSLALLGEAAMERLKRLRVAVIGVGGVGSWCAEALVRTGVHHLLLVDDDTVQSSNVNRQSPATSKTLGRYKVEALRERLLEINPACEIVARAERFTCFEGDYAKFDVIVDAIDSVNEKAELILGATASGISIVSSLGAAKRLDPTKVILQRFDKVEGDGLARALRQRFKRLNRFPAAKFLCAVSTEPPLASAGKGSYMPVTCAFGMALASAVLSRRLAEFSAARGENMV